MKHNEVKAYFKKKLIEKIPNYDILSIDETLSSRDIYIIQKDTMQPIILIKCWFGTNDFNVKAYSLNEEVKLNYMTDYFIQVKGTYVKMKGLNDLINSVINFITNTNLPLY